jgi:hypothetical protein
VPSTEQIDISTQQRPIDSALAAMEAVYGILYPTLATGDLGRDGPSGERAIVGAGDDDQAVGHERLRSAIMTDDESAHNSLFIPISHCGVSMRVASLTKAD